MTMWKDQGPFHAVFVYGVGEGQVTKVLPTRESFLECLADIDAAKKLGEIGLDYIRNRNGSSMLPSRVRPPPEPRRK